MKTLSPLLLCMHILKLHMYMYHKLTRCAIDDSAFKKRELTMMLHSLRSENQSSVYKMRLK